MLISIVIPAYNSEKYLSKTVQSVQAQTHTDWELVIVIDGSRDGTGPLAAALAAADSRIRVVYQENAGVAAARNRGFAMSADFAEYVLFLDADDVLESDALERLLSLYAANPTAFAAFGLARFIDDEGKPMRLGEAESMGRRRQSISQGRLINYPLTEPVSFSMLVHQNMIVTPGMVLIRRSVLNTVGLFDSAVLSTNDWDMWLRISREGAILFTDTVIINYRLHDSNASGSGQHMRAAEMRLRVKTFQDPALSVEQRRIALAGFRRSEWESAVQWWKTTWEALFQGRRREALRALQIAGKYCRWSLGTPLQGEKFSE